MEGLVIKPSRELPSRLRREGGLLAAKSVREAADQIGWLPWQVYEQADEDGRLIVAVRDGECVGQLLHRPANLRDGTLKILQTWVRPDARRIEHGAGLVAAAAAAAAAGGVGLLSCWVARDLEAMDFWPAIGFAEIEQRIGRGSMLATSNGRRPPRMLARFIATAARGSDRCPKTCDRQPF